MTSTNELELKKQVARAMGLEQNPDLPQNKHWYHHTELLDDDFEEVVGHQYINAEEEVSNVLALIQQATLEARIDELNKLPFYWEECFDHANLKVYKKIDSDYQTDRIAELIKQGTK